MTSPREHWFDPRLTVFIIWGLFVILFVCIPSKRIVQRICFLLGCRCCGYEEEVSPTHTRSGHEVHWELLSSSRKQEIDSLRASHLTYRLHPFSLTLEKKHMLRRISDTESPEFEAGVSSQNNENTSLPQDRKPDLQSSGHGDDIETGFIRGIDPPERDNEEQKEEEDDANYTHVSIPQPGHNFDGADMHDPTACTKDEKKPKEEKKSNKIRIFGTKLSKGEMKDEEEKEDSNATKQDQPKCTRRNCPIFCAICLSEFEASERISWSSNRDCTHVFHEDCIVQWLVSLGRTKSKNQRFSHEPSEALLLNYQLECPCCRQEFISREQAKLPALVGEENE